MLIVVVVCCVLFVVCCLGIVVVAMCGWLLRFVGVWFLSLFFCRCLLALALNRCGVLLCPVVFVVFSLLLVGFVRRRVSLCVVRWCLLLWVVVRCCVWLVGVVVVLFVVACG